MIEGKSMKRKLQLLCYIAIIVLFVGAWMNILMQKKGSIFLFFQSDEYKNPLEVTLKYYKAVYVQKNKRLASDYVVSWNEKFLDNELEKWKYPSEKVVPKKVWILNGYKMGRDEEYFLYRDDKKQMFDIITYKTDQNAWFVVFSQNLKDASKEDINGLYPGRWKQVQLH
jgi:hypothetical protein